jgi:hypothetical protein
MDIGNWGIYSRYVRKGPGLYSRKCRSAELLSRCCRGTYVPAGASAVEMISAIVDLNRGAAGKDVNLAGLREA